jgi:hypothetical protein
MIFYGFFSAIMLEIVWGLAICSFLLEVAKGLVVHQTVEQVYHNDQRMKLVWSLLTCFINDSVQQKTI